MPRPIQVHIRRSDKACEAKMNLELTDEDMILRIAAQCPPPSRLDALASCQSYPASA